MKSRRKKDVNVFSFAQCMFNAKSCKMVGWKFIKDNIEDGNNVTVRASATCREAGLVIKKYMTGKNWKIKFSKEFLLVNKQK